MSLTMEEIEKRLTDLSGALAHKCPGIMLEERLLSRITLHMAAICSAHERKSADKIKFLRGEVKYRMRSIVKIAINRLYFFLKEAPVEQITQNF
ncbi:hypothetical protein EJP81_03245 [Rahnella aquatilis]|nr:hypothetical protein D3Z09_03510 [Rahnella aquatilis]MQB54136.1 hypothetical protein [Rahnella sp. RcJ3]AZP40914.1 hypothetical protein EJP79_03240 [Rahnella aquatilis]AZP45255.1 hypothetical protein EJP81_03245 [Rahnella aquatilis]AZP49624.1 hypothetical protein EJP80_03410 [Rahnella aquatilis]